MAEPRPAAVRLTERCETMLAEAKRDRRPVSRWRVSLDIWHIGLCQPGWSQQTTVIPGDVRFGLLFGYPAEADDALPPGSLMLE